MNIYTIILQETVSSARQSNTIDWNAILGWILGGTGFLYIIIKGVIDRRDKELTSELTIKEKKVDKELTYTQEKLEELKALQAEIIEKEKLLQKYEVEAAVTREIMANQDLGMKRLLDIIKKIAPETATILDSWDIEGK